ncbi:MAG: Lon protease family protein [Gammaproteobacteria bacterium]
MKKPPLNAKDLYKPCILDGFHFETTEELEDVDVIIGQERATEAIQFGIRIADGGYNIFALAPSGTGKLTIIRQLIKHQVGINPVPPDWCYVNNFADPAKPKAIKLPPGKGKQFQQDIAHFLEELSIAIPTAFDGDEYRARVEELQEQSKQRESEALNKLREQAAQQRVILIETPTGYAFAPLDEKQEVIEPDKFKELSDSEKLHIQEAINNLQQDLQKLLKKFPAWRKETKQKLKALNREVAELAVSHLIDELLERYQDYDAILHFLNDARDDIIEHVNDFLPRRETPFPFLEAPAAQNPFRPYQVNLIVDNGEQKTAPLVYEDHPNYSNLLGRVDYHVHMGALLTDFTMIKPGALHRANGGYLILDARKLLLQPYAWESLKRILLSREIRIESLERSLSLISTASLEPEPIPLQVKIVLFGERILYYLLSYYDPEFQDLFKVSADFDDVVARSEKVLPEYARFLATLARYEKLRPLTQSAVCRIIEHCSRLAGDAEKLSTHLRSIGDLLKEANYWADSNSHEHILASDVQQAIDHKIFRMDRIRERLYENFQRGTLLLDTDGKVAGQINGLSVLQLGEFAFGQPSRITATTRLGEGKVVDIERETEMGGAIHSKGVMILSNFIAARYARSKPFSMTASLAFEQSYGLVEGDSASLAELCAILSSLAQLPLRQDLAVTGSVNQLGQVQPIGGVNEKIEGFFDVCKIRELTGKQGVIIPASNIKHLMLRWDVVHAAQAGQFHVYAVETVDEAMELLTDLPAGERTPEQIYPPESVNGLVEAQLLKFFEIKRSLMKRDGEDAEKR